MGRHGFTGRIIVSLTTVRHRAGILEEVLASFDAQSVKPDLVYLNISAEPYGLDRGMRLNQLPAETQARASNGRLIVQTVPNTGPYRKLLPVLTSHYEEKDCAIITADDDVAYPAEWIDGLVETHMRNEGVSAYRCRVMEVLDSRLAPYATWKLLDRPIAVNPLLVCPTGRCGILYRPGFFPDLGLVEVLRKLAPLQDDLGIKTALLMAGIPTYRVPPRPGLDMNSNDDFRGVSRGGKKLHQANVDGNDRAIDRISEYLRDNGFALPSDGQI